ncbi:CerR family C-terminal domain-containing protein [Prosthecomicrobium pneumaticum]|uniref:AcrR family transcriptional regulator n=1 Tax=Prosthecomicrobium pneumaticum TaxID=81895 RepID=A0A7W9FKA4_9HYPH|nr:CerR family C-terminal domain-containing protein [Prosthecomicrobium pneumaticum]MBB5752335.1 AcrR family transcriptional regulator [Prosthecomicrobium pneumaticum]
MDPRATSTLFAPDSAPLARQDGPYGGEQDASAEGRRPAELDGGASSVAAAVDAAAEDRAERRTPASRHYRRAKADRGGETRQRLVLAALDVFGRYGFEAAPTREIARRADANLAAIVYHFGGKDGLHRAVADYVVSRIGSQLRPTLEAMATGDLAALSRAQAIERLQWLAQSQVELMLGTTEAELWARFVMREQMEPSAVFEVIFDFMAGAHELICRLVGIALGEDPASDRVRMRVFTLLGQILVFRFCHPVVLRRLNKKSLTAEDRAEVAAILADNFEAILLGVAR